MSDTFTVRLDDTAVLARLAEIAKRVDDLSPAMRAIGEVLAESTKRRFASSTGPDGQRWAPLAKATVLARLAEVSGQFAAYTNLKTRKVGRVRVGDKKGDFDKDRRLAAKGTAAVMNMRPLVDTGILADSIRYALINAGRGVEIGTNHFTGEWTGGAAVHQSGNKKGTLPARPFLGMSADDSIEVLAILDRFLRQAVGQ